jgi:hypothetical protein
VLVYNNVIELPTSLVLKRWTMSARDGLLCCIPGEVDVAARQADEASMHGMLHASVMELVSMGVTSRRAFELAVDYVSHAKAAITAITVDDLGATPLEAQTVNLAGGDLLQFDPSIAAPPRVRSRGRPKELRFKSPIESPESRKRPASSSAAAPCYVWWCVDDVGADCPCAWWITSPLGTPRGRYDEYSGEFSLS